MRDRLGMLGRRHLLGLLAAVASIRPADAESSLKIVATTGMVGDIVREVVGTRGEVTALMGAGVDPHLYRATRSDMARMLEASIVFYNGLLLEGKMTDALVRVARAGKPVFAVTELIDESYLMAPPAFEGAFDPHVWMDPQAWMVGVEVVRASLVKVDPAGDTAYGSAAGAYKEKLRALDDYASAMLASVPVAHRILITAHDAFGYFGRRYGFEVEGIQGLSTESEAGLKRIEELVDLLVRRRIPAVFVETTIPEQSVRALIAGAAARGHEVVIGGSLFSDAMGPPGTYEGTYVGMIDHNVTTIARALGGTPPPRGLNGQLAKVG